MGVCGVKPKRMTDRSMFLWFQSRRLRRLLCVLYEVLVLIVALVEHIWLKDLQGDAYRIHLNGPIIITITAMNRVKMCF